MLPLTSPNACREAGDGSSAGAMSTVADMLLSDPDALARLQGYASDWRKALEVAGEPAGCALLM